MADVHHVVRVDMTGSQIRIYIDGKRYRWWHRLSGRLPQRRIRPSDKGSVGAPFMVDHFSASDGEPLEKHDTGMAWSWERHSRGGEDGSCA